MMVLFAAVVGCGDGALHKAAVDGDLETVKELVGAGADVNATTNNGWTVLRTAIEGGNTAVVDYLDSLDEAADE